MVKLWSMMCTGFHGTDSTTDELSALSSFSLLKIVYSYDAGDMVSQTGDCVTIRKEQLTANAAVWLL